MARKKKKGDQNQGLQVIVLVTAILNLIRAILNLVERFLE